MNEALLQHILNAIDTRIEMKLKNLKYDRTLTGVVKSILSGAYTVTINGEDSVCGIVSGLVVSVGNVVRVVVPCNDYSKKYIDAKVIY